MMRVAFWTAGVIAVALLTPCSGHGQSPQLQPGEPFEGELKGKQVSISYVYKNGGARTDRVYAAPLPVALKAGDPLTVVATVVGDRRIVGIQVTDPTGKKLGGDYAPADEESVTWSAKAVSARGEYIVTVFSETTGAFTVEVRSGKEGAKPGAKYTDLKQVDARIKQLEKELAELKAVREQLLGGPSSCAVEKK